MKESWTVERRGIEASASPALRIVVGRGTFEWIGAKSHHGAQP